MDISAPGGGKPRIRVRQDRDGRVVSAALVPPGAAGGQSPGFEAASYGRRLAGFTPSRSHVNTLLAGAGQTITARARWVARNLPFARNGRNGWVTHVIGKGPQPVPMLGDEALQKRLVDLFFEWAEDAGAEEGQNLVALLKVAASEEFAAGGCFVRIRPRLLSDGLAVPMQLQLLPVEMLDLNRNEVLGNGAVIRNGIEMNGIGRRVAYHFFRTHPGDTGAPDPDPTTSRVPAEDVIHFFDPDEPGQLGGMSRLVAAIVRLFQGDAYDDAEMERKKVAAMIAGFITLSAPDGEFMQEYRRLFDEDELPMVNLQPGTLQMLLPGQGIEFTQGTDVGGQYEDFQYRHALGFSAAMGIPYSMVTGDLRRANFISERAGKMVFKQNVDVFQSTALVPRLLMPIWRAFVRYAVLAGKISLPGYNRSPRAAAKMTWLLPSFPLLEPLKDWQGEKLAVDAGFKSRSQVIRERGGNPDQVDEERAAEREREERLGLPHAESAQHVTGMTSDEPSPDEADREDEQTKNRPGQPPVRPARQRGKRKDAA